MHRLRTVVDQRPGRVRLVRGPATEALARPALIVPETSQTTQGLAAVRAALAARTAALRRSVHLRHVDAGSDGAEEQEIAALLNPVYDIHRLGIFITASPRHADVLLVTGAGAHGMAEPLRRTYAGMPDPKIVIAVGTDAVSGGLAGGGYATAGGVARPGPGRRLGARLAPVPVQYLACPAGRARPAAATGGGPVNAPGAVLAAGLAALAVAAAVDLIGGARWPRVRAVPYLTGAAGASCLAAAGAAAVAGHHARLGTGGWLGRHHRAGR